MRNQHVIASGQKLTFGKHVLRVSLILTIFLPFIMEMYFLAPNIASIFSGKEWVRVILNENRDHGVKSISRFNSTESQAISRIGIDKNNNILVMLVKDPMSHIVIKNTFFEKKVPENGLRGNRKKVQLEKTGGHSFQCMQKAANLSDMGDRLLLRKDQCNCQSLENSFFGVTEDESGKFYSLKLDGQNSVTNPIFVQSISFVFLLLKWMILLSYIVAQLLLPLKSVKQMVNEKLLKSSAISIFYVVATSLSLSILGIEGMDCIYWWFLGSSPEYLLMTQAFIWLIASVCILLYLIQCFLEVLFNISRRYKLLNDFITTFIFIPAGLLIIISISLCILGIIKSWILMIWLTTVFIEFEKNLRILAKIYDDENISTNAESGPGRNSILLNTLYGNNDRSEEVNQEINIVELKEGVEEELEKTKENKSKLSSNGRNDMVIIPISNSYFKILDSRFENFSTKLCLWYITQHKETECISTLNKELNEYSNKNMLRIFEFPIYDFVKNIKDDNDPQSIYSDKTNSFSYSKNPRINSFLTESCDNQFICNICFLDFDSIVIFSPCGHGNVCLECLGDYISNNFKLKQQPKCHICREDISRMIEIRKDMEMSNVEDNFLEESGSFESTVSRKMNINSQKSERKIHLISNVKLIAEITCNKRSVDSLGQTRTSRSESYRSSNSSTITLKISRKNSNLWSHPRIKEFIENNPDSHFKTWIYNHFTRFFTTTRSRPS